jgi:hypothetical protein
MRNAGKIKDAPPAGAPCAKSHRHLGRVRARHQRTGTHHSDELVVAHPTTLHDHALAHHRDVRGRPTYTDNAEPSEQFQEFEKSTACSVRRVFSIGFVELLSSRHVRQG